MSPIPLSLLALAVGLAIWFGFNQISGMTEPWDHPDFVVGYGAAVGSSGILGILARRHAWTTGFPVIFAMFPVMALSSGIGPLIVIGLLFLAFLSIPACLAAEAAFRFKRLVTRTAKG